MGVDVDAKAIYGVTDKDADSNIPSAVVRYYEDFDNEPISLEELEDIYSKRDLKALGEFEGCILSYNSLNGNFEGFGYEICPSEGTNEFISKEDKERIDKTFKKYKLGKPKFQLFEHWW